MGTSPRSSSAEESIDAMNYLVRVVENEILLVMPASPQVPTVFRQNRDSHLAPLLRGVKVKMICPAEMIDRPGLSTELEIRSSEGAEIRFKAQVHMFLLVADRQCVATARDPNEPDSFRFFSQSEVVHLAVELFGHLWSTASGSDPTARQSQATSRRKAIIESLRRGGSDESGARATGVPLRTYQREVACLMRELGARTRFEAGFLLGARQRQCGDTSPGCSCS